MRNVKKAVVLAAGLGSRLNGASCPEGCKPLTRVAGVPMIRRILCQLQRVGIGEALIVVGHRRKALIDYLKGQKDLEIDLRFIDNNDYKLPNGISLLKSRRAVRNDPFLLMMSDHLIATEILRDLLDQTIPRNGVILAVDSKFPHNIDLEDATKVAVAGGRIWRIGKNMVTYTAIDTGTFLCSPAIFDCMQEAAARGDASLSAGMQIMADRRLLFPMDIGEYYWQDIDNSRDKMHAEEILFRELLGKGAHSQPEKITCKKVRIDQTRPSIFK